MQSNKTHQTHFFKSLNILSDLLFSLGKSVHPRFAPFIQAFESHELADLTLETIVFYVKGRVEGVPLYGVSGALGTVLNTKYIVKHRVQSGMLDKVILVYRMTRHIGAGDLYFMPGNI